MSGVVLRLDRVTVILIESIIGKGRLGSIGRWSSTTELRVVEKIGVVVVKRRSLEMRPSGLSLRSIEKGIIGGR
jgi:hypothetical protein